ncbi:MAG: hypothetical protein RIB93_13290 [Coleofasciculus sp. D1-CHI-01]|uniref:hypothetical protein n=1 Tax=Coleofasciculus sp. D1-CHI-01 TaxID=3068482 RepID=UPI0032FC70C6
MNKLRWIAGLGLVALLVSSCTRQNNQISQTPQPESSVATAPTQPEAETANNQSKTLVPPPPAGLIPSSRLIEIPVAKARQDPFSTVKVAPNQQSTPKSTTPPTQPQPAKTQPSQPKASETPAKTQPSPTLEPKRQPSPTKSSPTPAANKKSPETPAPKTQTPKPQPSPAPSETTVIEEPPAPSTELADAVKVSGVMQLEGQWNAIVKASAKTTSRYVRAGDSLLNGAVLVKRIELGTNKEPLVILEQNGVEVIKYVGSGNGLVASAD